MGNDSRKYGELPLAFGTALMQNPNAMKYFSALSKESQRLIIDKTAEIKSKDEMKSFVDSLERIF